MGRKKFTHAYTQTHTRTQMQAYELVKEPKMIRVIFENMNFYCLHAYKLELARITLRKYSLHIVTHDTCFNKTIK